MYNRRYDRQKPGEPIAARTLNRPIGGLEGLERARFSGGLRKQMGPGGIPLVSGSAIVADSIRTVQTPSAGIPAMSGTTPGQADCTLYVYDGTSQTLGTETVKVYNDITVAVPGSRKTKVYFSEGVWWFLVQACS